MKIEIDPFNKPTHTLNSLKVGETFVFDSCVYLKISDENSSGCFDLTNNVLSYFAGGRAVDKIDLKIVLDK